MNLDSMHWIIIHNPIPGTNLFMHNNSESGFLGLVSTITVISFSDKNKCKKQNQKLLLSIEMLPDKEGWRRCPVSSCIKLSLRGSRCTSSVLAMIWAILGRTPEEPSKGQNCRCMHLKIPEREGLKLDLSFSKRSWTLYSGIFGWASPLNHQNPHN